MKKGLISKFFILLLVVGLLFAVAPTKQAQAADIAVGPGQTYTTIQAAINAAAPGDMITVAAGTYNENVTVDKQLTIVGASADTVTVQAFNTSTPCFHITADGVSLSGFTVTGALNGETDAILLDGADNCTISNNIATNNYWGITLHNAKNNTLTGNVANLNTAVGIGLWGADTTGNQILANTASNNASTGILLSPDDGGNNIIDGNTVSANGKNGISISSSNNTVTNNTITGNATTNTQGAGIALFDPVSGNTIQFNTITGNTGYGGVGSTSSAANDISKNWWGSATGPKHVSNPGGTGDKLWTNKAIALLTYSPWLGMAPQDAYNGTVSGVFTTVSGVVTGNLTGDYNLTVNGIVSAYVDNKATFSGTVTGDIIGDITASINENGIGTLSGLVTNTGAVLPVRILGIFPQSGTTGDFTGQIITGEIPPLATSMAMTSAGDASTMFTTRTLQMGVVIDPDTAAYGQWSIWEPEAQEPKTGSTVDQNGLLTAGTNPGTVVVIAKALDGSLLDAQKTITIQELPATKLLMQTPITGTCNSTLVPGAEFTVDVLIQDVTDLMSYDVEVDFDETMVEVTNVKNGTFLTGDLLYVETNGYDNATGKVNYGVSLKGDGNGVVIPKSGSGTLFTITFKPLKAGVSAFTINAAGSELVHYDSYLLIPFEVIGEGSLNFGGVVRNTNLSAEYCDLASAVAGASSTLNQTLQFLADFTIPSRVEISKTLTLDLNGKIASFNGTTHAIYHHSIGKTLTIKDSVGGGAIRANGATARGIWLRYGNLVIEGGTIQGEQVGVELSTSISTMTLNGGTIGGEFNGTKYSGVLVYGGGNVNVNGGVIQSKDLAISGNGTSLASTTITINGGTINSDIIGIYHPQPGTLNIYGGTITAPTAVEMRSGTLNVTGGTIHGTGDYVAVPDLRNGWSTATGDAIFVGTSDGTYSGNIQVNISGTTAVITSDEGYALREAVLASVPATNAKKINIIGGQLTGGVEVGEALEAVTFSQKLVDANTAGTSDLDLLPGGKYNTDPGVFVYAPYGSYFADSWWQIMELTGIIAWDPGQTGQVVGEAPLGVVVSGNTIDFTGKIEWYPAAPGRTEGNRVGVQISAPAGFPTAGTTFTFAGSTYNWDDVNDGDNFLWIYPLVTTTPQSWDIVVTWKTGVTQTFTINVTSTSTLNTPPAPTITSADVEGPYIPGVPQEFTINLSNPGGAYYELVTFDYQIIGVSKADITSFEYYNELGQWIAMGSRPQETYVDCTIGGVASICGQFGWAPGGFGPFPADFTGVSNFRINFLNGKVDPLPLTLTLKGKKTGAETDWTVLKTFTANIDVYENVQITGTAPVYYLVGDAGASTITVTNPAGGAPYGNTIVFDMTIADAEPTDITSAVCTYAGVPLDINALLQDTGTDLEARLVGVDGFFEVTAPFGMTIDCSITYATAKEYDFTSEMVYVVGTNEYVVATNTATAIVYPKPVITSADLPGSFQEGVAKDITVNVDNVGAMYSPNSFILHLDLPKDTTVVYGEGESAVTYTCTANGCDIPVTLAAGNNAIPLTVTFNAPSTADVNISLVDPVVEPDLTLATFTAGNEVHANIALVTGSVTMQARTTYNYAKFWLTGTNIGYGPYDSTSDAAGALSFANIIVDEYTITTNMARYLNIYCNEDSGDAIPDLCKKITLSGNDTLEPLRLRGGNANWTGGDNIIDGLDASQVGTDWTTLFPVQDLTINCGDVNFDGKVNIQDLALVGGNFDLTSAAAYGTTWVP